MLSSWLIPLTPNTWSPWQNEESWNHSGVRPQSPFFGLRHYNPERICLLNHWQNGFKTTDVWSATVEEGEGLEDQQDSVTIKKHIQGLVLCGAFWKDTSLRNNTTDWAQTKFEEKQQWWKWWKPWWRLNSQRVSVNCFVSLLMFEWNWREIHLIPGNISFSLTNVLLNLMEDHFALGNGYFLRKRSCLRLSWVLGRRRSNEAGSICRIACLESRDTVIERFVRLRCSYLVQVKLGSRRQLFWTAVFLADASLYIFWVSLRAQTFDLKPMSLVIPAVIFLSCCCCGRCSCSLWETPNLHPPVADAVLTPRMFQDHAVLS